MREHDFPKDPLTRGFIGLEHTCAFHGYARRVLESSRQAAAVDREERFTPSSPCRAIFERARDLWAARMEQMDEARWPHCRFSARQCRTAGGMSALSPPGAAVFHVF